MASRLNMPCPCQFSCLGGGSRRIAGATAPKAGSPDQTFQNRRWQGSSFLPIRHSLIIMRKARCCGPSQRDSNTPIQPNPAKGKCPKASGCLSPTRGLDGTTHFLTVKPHSSSACSSVPDNRCPSPNELARLIGRRALRPGNQLARRPNLDTGAS